MDEIERIKIILKNHEKRLSELEGLFRKSTPVIKPLSIREFLNEKNPNSDTDKTLAMGYYLEKYKGLTPFNKNDLKKIFIEAREKIPLNINDKINLNIRKGYIMEVGEKEGFKAFQLTNSGEKYVENNFKKVK